MEQRGVENVKGGMIRIRRQGFHGNGENSQNYLGKQHVEINFVLGGNLRSYIARVKSQEKERLSTNKT